MDALALQGIGINGQSGDQGLAFSGLHFCDLTLVQNQSANELYVIMALFKVPAGNLPDGGKSFGHNVIQGFALSQASPKLRSHSLEFLVGHILKFWLKFGNPLSEGG